jgi:hypothetical protein
VTSESTIKILVVKTLTGVYKSLEADFIQGFSSRGSENDIDTPERQPRNSKRNDR